MKTFGTLAKRLVENLRAKLTPFRGQACLEHGTTDCGFEVQFAQPARRDPPFDGSAARARPCGLLSAGLDLKRSTLPATDHPGRPAGVPLFKAPVLIIRGAGSPWSGRTNWNRGFPGNDGKKKPEGLSAPRVQSVLPGSTFNCSSIYFRPLFAQALFVGQEHRTTKNNTETQ